jgi:molybdopterin synthase catalytic subunit
VEGKANHVCDVALADAPLEASRAPMGEGAVVEFLGNVRPSENGRGIIALDYEAHGEMAEHQLRAIAEEAAAKFSLLGVVLHHRVGRIRVGETSLLLRVMSLHRGAAFAASIWIVDELKKRVPIWKTPVFAEAGELSAVS